MNKNWKKDYSKYKRHFTEFQKETYDFIASLIERHRNAIHIADLYQRPKNEIKSAESIEANLNSGKYKNSKTIFDIKDIAGVRVICHCEDDAKNFSTLLEGELRQNYRNVGRKPIGGKGSEYPYRAIHLTFAKIFKEGNISFLQIPCEIQILTVMAEAWAVQNHKYVYKKIKEGEAHELTTAVSEIMNGCEKLWSLVKKKSSQKEEAAYSKEIPEIHKKTIASVKLAKISNDQIKELKDWFESNKKTTFEGLRRLGIKTFMEVEIRISSLDLNISKKILKESARDSTIRTFGWPIGVFSDSRKEFSPKVDLNGIHAEIAIK
ncbi:RelA/SpoT domain-containing protein, partial [bacterium]|nr:RelA/SpoT domain-containing protein [bacterium]